MLIGGTCAHESYVGTAIVQLRGNATWSHMLSSADTIAANATSTVVWVESDAVTISNSSAQLLAMMHPLRPRRKRHFEGAQLQR